MKKILVSGIMVWGTLVYAESDFTIEEEESVSYEQQSEYDFVSPIHSSNQYINQLT